MQLKAHDSVEDSETRAAAGGGGGVVGVSERKAFLSLSVLNPPFLISARACCLSACILPSTLDPTSPQQFQKDTGGARTHVAAHRLTVRTRYELATERNVVPLAPLSKA